MKTSFKLSLVTALLLAAGFAYSQGPMNGNCEGAMGGGMMQGGHERMGRMNPARMQVMMERRNAALKAQLKLTPAQEGAWTTYTAAMKPPAALLAQWPDRAEMAKLSTPERLDKMKALRTQHMADMTAAMEQHDSATRALYAALTPEQQKVFDGFAMQWTGRGHGPRAGHGPMMPKQ
ncbi:hypothetical protein GALL_462480 [mine drainage metagenome]|uniref:Periplasmic protein n=1 Tax=mine drainage metagenome TaxID=410659 RepID=A0A1J5PMV0_9ZZZZ